MITRRAAARIEGSLAATTDDERLEAMSACGDGIELPAADPGCCDYGVMGIRRPRAK